MRLMTYDATDGSLLLLDVVEVNHDTETETLYMETAAGEWKMPECSTAVAEGIMTDLFENGKADAREFGLRCEVDYCAACDGVECDSCPHAQSDDESAGDGEGCAE